MSKGSFSIHAVPVATLPIPGWEAFFGQNDVEFRDLVFYVWLLSDGERHGLVDLGVPALPADFEALDKACQGVDVRSAFKDVRSLDEALAELGVQPDDIEFALITQTIAYHTGGLERRWLPNAHVYMSRAGVTEMLVNPPGHPPVGLYFTARSWSYVRELAMENRLHVVDEPTEVVPGVVFETTGGHHPGSAGVRVHTANGVVGLLETAFYQRNVDELMPIGIAEDASLCREVIKRYRAECDDVVAIHDPNNAKRFAVSS